jgi:hypothetical protein
MVGSVVVLLQHASEVVAVERPNGDHHKGRLAGHRPGRLVQIGAIQVPGHLGGVPVDGVGVVPGAINE